MPYNYFVIILRCLHVCDNTKIDCTDKLAKIRPMLNILVATWQAAYYPNQEICLDESMIAFKGRNGGAMVYQSKKPHKWGMQAWFLVDSRTGYCCQQTVQLPAVPKPIQLKQTISPKTRTTNVSKEII